MAEIPPQKKISNMPEGEFIVYQKSKGITRRLGQNCEDRLFDGKNLNDDKIKTSSENFCNDRAWRLSCESQKAREEGDETPEYCQIWAYILRTQSMFRLWGSHGEISRS
jgi:hypothetical protein